MYSDILTFYVVDACSPSSPSNLVKSWVNGGQEDGNPRIDWNSNSELDFGYYEIWKKIDNWFDPDVDWFANSTTTSNYYIDLDEQGWGTFGPPRDVYYKIKAVDINTNESSFSSSVIFRCEQHLNKNGVLPEFVSKEPLVYELKSNYPNPFNPTTQISYQIPENSFVNLIVYNALGQEVAQLVNQHQSSGQYSVKFNAANLPSGVYIYKLQTNNFSDVKKMLIMK